MARIRNQRIGRNDACHCGSGKKFKRCHGDLLAQQTSWHPNQFAQSLSRAEAQEAQRIQQQGLGKPIISTKWKDHRLVAVGNGVYFRKTWKTFPDFLSHFVRQVLTPEWGNRELKKDECEMHPVALWYRKNAVLQAAHAGAPGEVFSTPATGAVRSYLELAYNLYLLEHNVELRSRLVERLKHVDQFLGALTEIRVAGMFIRAGFSMEFENEDDSTRSHCEYTATHRDSGKKFSIEVKTRSWGAYPKDDELGHRAVKIGTRRLLRAAIKKEADHERIVFIELAMPDEMLPGGAVPEPWWLQCAVDGLRDEETELLRKGEKPPPAYVIFANHPHRHHLDTTAGRIGLVSDSVGDIDFRGGMRGSIREALRFREKHAPFLALWTSIEDHRHIPITFDGRSPHLAFGGQPPRLEVGSKYLVPSQDGSEVVAELVDAIAVPSEHKIYDVYRTSTGEHIICTNPMTDAEKQAYQDHPETFFGVVKREKGVKGPLELFDFFYDSYRHTPREKLLEFMSGAADIGALRTLPQEELAITYCERLVYTAMEKTGMRA